MTSQVESPILSYNSLTETYATSKDGFTIYWCCYNRLRELFQVKTTDRISFVAKSRASKDTYKVEIGGLPHSIIKPIYADLYDSLCNWLEKQIEEGRPHIGVLIVTEEKEQK